MGRGCRPVETVPDHGINIGADIANPPNLRKGKGLVIARVLIRSIPQEQYFACTSYGVRFVYTTV